MREKPIVLVVEDEPAIADTIQYALETDGCEPLCVTTAQQAREVLQAGRVDLLVLDIGLPDMNGVDLCKEIRMSSTVPIIFLTARTDEVDRVVGLEVGGDDYVVKPFSPRELAARVKAVLRRTRPAEPPHLDQRIFAINGSRHQISYYNIVLDLSRYEYNIMLIFVRRPGVVFSREQLMAQAWEEPEASMDRTVDAHIKNIRAKLRQIRPEADPIVTHRGIGYSLKETP